MKKTTAVWVAACLVGTAIPRGQADEPPEPKAVIEKAIQAAGGEAKLGGFRAAAWKGNGTFHGPGEAVPFTGAWALWLPDHARVLIEMEWKGTKLRQLRVLNGDKGWIQVNEDRAQEMSPESLAEEKETLHASRVSSLLPLKDGPFQLAAGGEGKVGERAAVGVRVSSKGHRDVTLFFDKETGLLLRSETSVKDRQGKEVAQEVLYGDYKEVEGVKQALKITLNRDGKPFLELERSDVKPLAKPDAALFDKP